MYTTTVPLVSGENYRFKVEARNTVGYSALSEEIIIRAAEIPSIPIGITTEVVDDVWVLIQWTAPYDGGSPISSYTITIRESDYFTYSEAPECDGTTSDVITNTECRVAFDTLVSFPFELPWGSSVYAKVRASNLVGDSSYSYPGNGALMYTKPDPP